MKPTLRLLGLLLAGAVFGPPPLAQAQTQTLEFTTGAGNPSASAVGPTVASQVITFQANTDNPTGTNFAAYAPLTQVTFALSNQRYSLPTTKIATGTGVSFGGNINNSGQQAGGLSLFPTLDQISSPADANYSSAPNTLNTGIGVATNNGVEFLVSAEPLPATVPGDQRYQYADLTITFSQPIVNPVLNIAGLGALYGSFGFTTEFDLLTSGVTLSRLSGSRELSVNATQILNNASAPTDVTGSGAASGSVLVATPTAGITSVALRLYLRPNAAGGTIHSSNNSTHAGDGWILSVSSLTPAPPITGYVFEDVNYGGGAGRPRSTNGTVARPNARVELYNAAGTFVAATTTDANGFYSFAPGTGTYTVRVVGTSVTSSRTGSVSSLVPVQTYNGTTTRVGGEAPEKVEAGNGTSGTTLASLNTATTIAESQAVATTAAGTDAVPGPDFGYNFDLVVNTNDAGQGSLRQFIINCNTLTSSSALAQVGSNAAGPLQTGKENSIFMIPSGAAVPGQLAGLVSGLNSNGVAAIAPLTALPAITGGNTTIDGTTQTFNIGNTNNVTLGTGGTVGTAATALGQLNGPEVQLRGTRSYEGLSVTANNATIRGLSIYGFTNDIGVGTDYTGLLIEQNVLGTSATSFTDPGNNVRSTSQGVNLYNSDNGIVRNNLIGFNGGMGVWVYGDGNGANNNLISGNEIRGNALEVTANGQGRVFEGLEFQGNSTGNTASGNLITASMGNGIDTYGNTIGGNTITGNTISNNGQGVVTTTGNEGSGLRIYSATNPTTISNNILNNNNGSGMLLVNSAAKVLVSQNAIFGNTRVGIDLLTNAEASANIANTYNGLTGTTSNVTLNSAATTGGNGLLNYPVLTSATLVGTNLLVKGYAKGTAIIEFFSAQPTASAAASPNNLFGQGAAYLATATEGTADADSRTGLSYSGNINGFNQGSDTNANGFSFLIPLTAAQQLALTAGTLLTSTATLGGATSEFSGNVRINSAPVPATLTNVSIPNNFPATVLNPNLSATANGTFNGAANSISYYTIASLPTSGTLTYNGTVLTSANIAATQITPALLNTLTYTPDRSFSGNASFTYTATDANGATSTTASNGGTVTTGAAIYTIPVIASADVTTTISGPGVLGAGQPSGTFTATFTNNGPSDATGVTQSVTLPSGATLTPAQQLAITTAYPGTSFGASNAVINFPTTTTLASGATVVRQFAFTAPLATTAISITSNVGTATSQGVDTAPNSATLPLTVTAVADVATTISPASASVAAGTLAQFNVAFSNVGPQDAAGVVGKVQLPLGLANVTTSAGSYNAATGVITYNIGSLAASSAQPLTLTVTYTQPTNGSVTATTAVSTTSYEAGQTANNSASATIAPTSSVDVATVIGGPATTTVGAQVTYNVTTSSVGTATATNVVQTVTLPSGATNIFVTGGGVISGSTVTFPAIAALAVGQSVNNTVSFTAPNVASLNVGASVTATNDNNASNNTSTATTTTAAATAGSANLYTTIVPSATNVAGGTSLTFTVTEGNQGPNSAASVVTRVALPVGLPIMGATALKIGGNAPTSTSGTVATYGSGATAITYDSSTGIVTFAPIATQGSAATPASYTLTFNAPASGVVVATSTVASTTPDVMLSNNVASTQVTIDPAATDVATTLTGPDAATPGQLVAFTVTTTNNGPAAATSVVQTVVIPAGLPIAGPAAVTIGGSAPTSTAGTVATYANGATYNSATGVVTFATIASQMAGNTVSNTIVYAVPANGDASLVNTARVTSASTDRVPANNAASVVTTIQTSADVQVALTGPSTAAAGALVSYGVTTTNNGPSVAASVATTVQLPAGLSNVTVIGFDGSTLASAYNSGTGVVTFPAVSSQAPGAANASTGSISFAAPADGTTNLITPTATAVVTGTTDPALGNNSATVATTLTAPTGTANDLAVTLSRSAATATAGSAISFTFAVTNNGSTTATGVVATVQLPAGLPTTGTSAVTVAGQGPSSTSGTVATYSFPGVSITYDSSTGLLVSTGISLNAGATTGAAIGIPQAPGTGPVVATATVRGDQPDTNLSNNLATQSIVITAVSDVATAISGPSVAPNGGPVAYTVVTSNAGLSPIGGVVQTVTLPAGITGYSLNGTAVVLGSTPTAGTTTITLPTPSTLAAGTASAVANTISFVAPAGTTFNVVANVTGTNDAVAANNAATQTTTRFNAPPVATNVTNTLQSPEGNTATAAMLISPLAATSATSTIKQFNLSSVPPTSQGVLYYDNNGALTAITADNYPSLNLTPTQATTLRFLPATGYVGNATFTYTATDNNNLVSNVATYLIPVGFDNSSVYTNSTQVKGGGNKYVTGDVLAYVVDSNTAQYNSSGQMYNAATGVLQSGATNGLTSAVLASGSAALPAGVSLNPTTGQIYVSDATKLVNNQTAQTYTVRITTTDSNGGVNTQNVSFTIGAYPLPVTLVTFTAQAVQNRDALLNWATASEKNNDHFDIERSFDGTSFVKIGQVAGHGTTTVASAYALTDAGVAAKATGPVYYRLRQVDLDGTATYSPVRTVSFTKAAVVGLSLYPNPVVDLTNLDLTALDAATLVQAQLFDAAGRSVLSWTLAGGQLQSLDLSNLASGSYLLVVTGQQPDGSPLRQVLRATKK